MRGMKKWLPFKSLSGQYEVLEERKKERSKVTRPELSLDEIDELNQALTSLKKGEEAKVTYFVDGVIVHNKPLVFLRCDGAEQKVFFKGLSLPFRNLLRIEREENFDFGL